MKTWALNVGDPKGCQSGGGLHSIVQAGERRVHQRLLQGRPQGRARGLLGEIREQARSFATAAVPSVQATSDQAIYVSSFTPLNEKSVWDGHLNAFLKPLPVDQQRLPRPRRHLRRRRRGRVSPVGRRHGDRVSVQRRRSAR